MAISHDRAPLPTDAGRTPPTPRRPHPPGAAAAAGPGDGDAPRCVAQAAAHLDTLVRLFPRLVDELVPGRPSRSSAAPLGSAALARQAARARAERQDALLGERMGVTISGSHAAPVRLSVSDAIRDVTDGVIELEEAVCEKLRIRRPRRGTVPERLERIRAVLDRVADHPVLAEHVRDETRRMAGRCRRCLGETAALLRLDGRCPHCDSVSLRAVPEHELVLCANPGCRCAEADCPCRVEEAFRHAWGREEWPALAAGCGLDLARLLALAEGAAA
ncbi:hypothetical protein [Allostreptomyces psammosilenae]|uniref:Uncharacterized protein n=1 Tax=Allostreptomyces psammosilenae TaxID=1892865 RepID=A0A852ZTR8_9ACTN|nr:hypothetical protein [Allostreptomyces psammosilenae]NYI05245.1 hypothetical protein [Allostreptomyces psammosilenae]